MALRGIQEYIARDVNNIAQVEDEGNIVSIEGNIFLYPLKRAIQYYYYSYRALCAILLFYNREWLLAAILSVYKQAENSSCSVRACVEWSSSATQILTTNHRRKSMLNDWSHEARAIMILLPSLSQSAWNTQFYFGHQKPSMDNNRRYLTCQYILYLFT